MIHDIYIWVLPIPYTYITLLQTYGRFSLWSIFDGNQNDGNFEAQLYIHPIILLVQRHVIVKW